MISDLTFNTIAFKKAYDNKDESLRQSTARGINTPDRLIIKSQPYTDATTKVDGSRYTGRVERVDVDANGVSIVTQAYFVLAVPSTATSGQVTNIVATFKALVADTDFIAAVLNNEK
jgi:hypothetical protein